MITFFLYSSVSQTRHRVYIRTRSHWIVQIPHWNWGSENRSMNREVENGTRNRKKSTKEQKGEQNREQKRNRLKRKWEERETLWTERTERRTGKDITIFKNIFAHLFSVNNAIRLSHHEQNQGLFLLTSCWYRLQLWVGYFIYLKLMHVFF